MSKAYLKKIFLFFSLYGNDKYVIKMAFEGLKFWLLSNIFI